MSEAEQKKYMCVSCNGILRKPIKCTDCKTRYCKSCYFELRNNKCMVTSCGKIANERNFEDVPKDFKDKLGQLEMKCSICYRNMTHKQYLDHFTKCVHMADEERFFNVTD